MDLVTVLLASENDISDTSYEEVIRRLVYEGGYLGNDMDLRLEYSNNRIDLDDIVIWENNGTTYLSKTDGKELLTKTK